jgi:multiple sugar transport system substrate-binding protein
MKRKLISLLLVSTMAASLFAGCGSSSDSASTGGSSSSGSTDKIRVSIWDNNQKDGLQKIADKWSETSGIEVSIEVITWDSYWTLLEAGASGGDMPDVFWMHSNEAQKYMEAGKLLDLSPYIEADDTIDTSRYLQGVWDLFTSGDSQYALPKDHDTNAMLYNKALFDEVGIDYPDDTWSWDDVYEAAKAITEGTDANTYGIAFNVSNNQDTWYNIVQDYGAQIITDDHKGTTIGSDEGKAGMEMVRKLLTVGTPQSVVAESGTDSLFTSGVVGMIFQGSYQINTFYTADNADDYAWALLPYGDANGNGQCDEGERQCCYNGLGWAANVDAADPDACYSLIAYFCSEEGQLLQSEYGVTMGGMDGVSEAFENAFPGLDISAFLRIEEEGTLFFRPYTRNTTVWEDALQQSGGFLEAWQNPDDPELMATACDNAQKIIEDAIAAE